MPMTNGSLFTRQVTLFLLLSVAAFANFHLLFAVVPLYASKSSAAAIGAGLATGAMMLGTVLTELATPRLLSALGFRYAMALGILLLGVPVGGLMLSDATLIIIVASLLRGAGLAVLVVAGTSLAAELAPHGRRGEGLGFYGLAVSVPAILGLPAGIWLSKHLGYNAVFSIGIATALLAMLFVPQLPDQQPAGEQSNNVLAALRQRNVARPALIFLTTTLTAGVVVTFLPLALGEELRNVASLALLVQSCAVALTRWLGGRLGDRFGADRLLAPAMLLAAIGTLLLVSVDSPVIVVGGMLVFGIGFGAAQNLTLSLMFARASKADFSNVSALWNLAFDAGMGIGAVGFGLIAQQVGYAWSFGIVAAITFAALLPAMQDRTA
jgi:predicted MFS family arabinose efflux permease